jgi:ribosomal RNA-processing protein 1
MDELELRKLWRGLFFCMWLADKAPVQAELAGKVAELVHCFNTPQGVRSWLLICGRTMRGEWGRLDKYRVDKYYVLIRSVVREVRCEAPHDERCFRASHAVANPVARATRTTTVG